MTPGAFMVSKLDAARRQLRTAIRMWFADGDPVAIHVLAYAAHEIIDAVSLKRNPQRELLYDTAVIKDEYRQEWIASLSERKGHGDLRER